MQYITPAARLTLTGWLILILSCYGWAVPQDNLLRNGGAEQLDESGKMPADWYCASVSADELKMVRDTGLVHSGHACFAIKNDHIYDRKVSNNWAQKISDIPTGKTVRLSGYIRTRDVEDVNLCVQCWNADGQQLLGFGSTAVLHGTHDWTFEQTSKVEVPPGTSKMIARAALTGKGEAYFDDLVLEIVDDVQTEDKDLFKQVGGRILETLPVVKDCMILAYLPRWKHGNLDNIAAANNDGGVRTLLAWQEPPHKYLAEPKLQFLLAIYVRKAKAPDKSERLAMHEILDNWEESTSWEQQPAFSPDPTDRFEIIPGEGWKYLDVTSFIRGRAETEKVIRGVMLRFAKEDSRIENNTYTCYEFVSREGVGQWSNRHPVLLVVDPSNSP